jgi:hypothetical protein
MAEYSRLAKVKITGTGLPQTVNLPFVPDYVTYVNLTAMQTPIAGNVTNIWWDANMGQGVATSLVLNGGLLEGPFVFTTNGVSTFAAGLSFQYGPTQQVVSTTKGYPTTFTVTAHGYANGDVVMFQGLYETPTTGMPQMGGIPFTVQSATANTFTVQWDTTGSNYTALTGSPLGATVKKVLYPFMYVPGDNIIAQTVNGTTTTVFTTTAHNYVVGQEIAFRIPSIWGDTGLNSLPNNVIPGSPIYGYVTQVVSYNQFVCNINSTTFTAFNPNQPVSSLPGLSFAQVVAVGDVNSGGWPYTGGALYPSPIVTTYTGISYPTINGPAIQGAFINNTRQGFILGSSICGLPGDIIYAQAFLHDYSSP